MITIKYKLMVTEKGVTRKATPEEVTKETLEKLFNQLNMGGDSLTIGEKVYSMEIVEEEV